MRAFVIYNDVGTIGVSIIATVPDDENTWTEAELAMEDHIGALRDMEAVAAKVADFPSLFPSYAFHRGMVYGDMDKAVIDVREEEGDVITGVGYKIVNPPQVKVEFKTAPVIVASNVQEEELIPF